MSLVFRGASLSRTGHVTHSVTLLPFSIGQSSVSKISAQSIQLTSSHVKSCYAVQSRDWDKFGQVSTSRGKSGKVMTSQDNSNISGHIKHIKWGFHCYVYNGRLMLLDWLSNLLLVGYLYQLWLTPLGLHSNISKQLKFTSLVFHW